FFQAEDGIRDQNVTGVQTCALPISFRQIEIIQLIDKEIGLHALPDKLREIAILRVRHQDVSLKELGELVPSGKISKSGVNHRLKKIDQFADKIRQGESI